MPSSVTLSNGGSRSGYQQKHASGERNFPIKLSIMLSHPYKWIKLNKKEDTHIVLQ